MNRIEIESALNKDRAWLIETYAEMSEEELLKPSAKDSCERIVPRGSGARLRSGPWFPARRHGSVAGS